MSFQNEDEEEDLSPNLSSEEFNELANNDKYKEEITNSEKEHEIKIGEDFDDKENNAILSYDNNENEINIYKRSSYSTNNIKENKNKILNDLNFSYKNDLNKEISKNNNYTIKSEEYIDNNKKFKEEIKTDNINNDNNIINNNNIQKSNINKSLENTKNLNMNILETDIGHNYQSFLTERLNLINQNLNKEQKNENEINSDGKENINKNDYYKYKNFSKKDIMNYYFNLDNTIENKNYVDTIKMDNQYRVNNKLENNNNKINNNDNTSKQNQDIIINYQSKFNNNRNISNTIDINNNNINQKEKINNNYEQLANKSNINNNIIQKEKINNNYEQLSNKININNNIIQKEKINNNYEQISNKINIKNNNIIQKDKTNNNYEQLLNKININDNNIIQNEKINNNYKPLSNTVDINNNNNIIQKEKINNNYEQISNKININNNNEIINSVYNNKDNIRNDNIIINNEGYNISKDIDKGNIIFENMKTINTLESVNIRRMDEEEEDRKIIIENEYKKLSLLEKEKMELIKEEKLVRQKIAEEIEKQEKEEEKKKERMIKYMEKMKKKEEDMQKLKDIKLKQEQELKEIYELKNKKKLEEEKLFLIIKGKLKLNNQELNNYSRNFQYDDNINNKKDENEFIKENNYNINTIPNEINNNEDIMSEYKQNIIQTKSKTISDNNDINNGLNSFYYNKSIDLKIDYNNIKEELNKKETQKNLLSNPIINHEKENNKEKQISPKDYTSFSPSISSLKNIISNISIKSQKNNFSIYENIKPSVDDQIIRFSDLYNEDNNNKNKNYMMDKYLSENDNKIISEKNIMNNFYDKKRKKNMKKKIAEKKLNYKTNIYNDKKIFQKLMDNYDNNIPSNKENKDLNEVNKIKEIAFKTKNQIDKTLDTINNLKRNIKSTINNNTERIFHKKASTLQENPYLKYGKKRLKNKKENNKVITNKQNLNMNSRNINEYLSDNFGKMKYQKSYKELNLNKINNNENVDYNNNHETINYANYKEYKERKSEKNKFNFNGVLSGNISKLENYYKEIYGKI